MHVLYSAYIPPRHQHHHHHPQPRHARAGTEAPRRRNKDCKTYVLCSHPCTRSKQPLVVIPSPSVQPLGLPTPTHTPLAAHRRAHSHALRRRPIKFEFQLTYSQSHISGFNQSISPKNSTLSHDPTPTPHPDRQHSVPARAAADLHSAASTYSSHLLADPPRAAHACALTRPPRFLFF